MKGSLLRYTTLIGLSCLTLALAQTCWAEVATTITDVATSAAPVVATAQGLLEEVRASFPTKPLRLTGQVQSKSRSGEVELSRNIEMVLEWGAATPTASYTLMDNFGKAAETLVVHWPKGKPAVFNFSQSGSDKNVPLKDPSAPIGGLDFSWTDLSLDYLWWPDGQIIGQETLKSRRCYIVELGAPAGATNSYAKVQLWIDPEVHVLLKAEGYDARNELVRRLLVKSFKRVDNLWTLQDMDIQSFPSRHKTTLRVRDVTND